MTIDDIFDRQREWLDNQGVNFEKLREIIAAYAREQYESGLAAAYGRGPSWNDPVPETHDRCMHCGAYADECQCDGGISR